MYIQRAQRDKLIKMAAVNFQIQIPDVNFDLNIRERSMIYMPVEAWKSYFKKFNCSSYTTLLAMCNPTESTVREVRLSNTIFNCETLSFAYPVTGSL